MGKQVWLSSFMIPSAFLPKAWKFFLPSGIVTQLFKLLHWMHLPRTPVIISWCQMFIEIILKSIFGFYILGVIEYLT